MFGIHRVMAGININEVQKEWDTVFDFIMLKNGVNPAISWHEYCTEFRGGKQDLQELSKLVSSLCDVQPWRFIVSVTDLNEICSNLVDANAKMIALRKVDEKRE